MTQHAENYVTQNSRKMQEFMVKNENTLQTGIKSVSAGVENIHKLGELQDHYRTEKRLSTSPIRRLSTNETPDQIPKTTRKPTLKIKRGQRTQRVQRGGKSSPYTFITNPVSGRKVSIFGKIGQRVIQHFLENMRNGE